MSANAYLWTIEIENNETGRFREKIESLCMELRMMLGRRQCCYRVVRQQCDPNGNRRPGGRLRHCRRRWPRGHDFRCWRAGKDLLQARLVRFSASPWLLSWRPALLWNSPTRNWRICLKELSICRTWVPFPAANCSHNDNHSTATKGQ